MYDLFFFNSTPYPQAAKAHVLGIVVVRKRKAVPGVEPTVVPVAPFLRRS